MCMMYNIVMSPYYKGMKVDLLGLPVWVEDKSGRTKRSRRQRNFYAASFPSPFKESSPKNLIVMYDVPFDQKKERNWFRRHLIKFGYVMIQKSVWVGPSPLPKNFLKYLKEMKIEDNFRAFQLTKPYNSKMGRLG